jgi:DNA polymerase
VDWWKEIDQAPYLAVDFETQSESDAVKKPALDMRYNEIVSVQISWRDTNNSKVRNLYVPFKHFLYKFNWPDPRVFLEKLLIRPKQLIIYHNAPFEYGCCRSDGFDINIGNLVGFTPSYPFVDTSVMSWIWDENLKPKLKMLMEELLGFPSLDFPFVEERIGAFPPEAIAPYGCQDSYGTLLLYEFFRDHFSPAQAQLYFGLEQEITQILCEAKWRGIGIDTFLLRRFERLLEAKALELEQEIKTCFGISKATSSAQIRKALNDKGFSLRSTAAEYLDRWISMYEPLLDEQTKRGLKLIRPFRYIQKYLQTYLHGPKGIVKNIWPDNCIRPDSFQWSLEERSKQNKKAKQRGTVSGRFSYTNPSFNTFIKDPKDIDLDQWMDQFLPEIKLRRLVVPPQELGPDYLVLCGDGSQIEMRTTASATKDQKLLDYFNVPGTKKKLYIWLAEEILGQAAEKGSPEYQLGKGTVLGKVYGAGAKKLSKKLWKIVMPVLYKNRQMPMLKGQVDEAQVEREIIAYIDKAIRKLTSRFQGLGVYHKKIEELALQTGGKITTRLGRTRTIPGFKKGNYKGVLQLANFKPQSEAAEICKLAMQMFRRKANERGLKAHIIANVHDEAVIFVHKDDALEAAKLLHACFIAQEWVLDPPVKLEASISIGLNWGDQIEFDPFSDPLPVFFSPLQEIYNAAQIKDQIKNLIQKAKPCQKCDLFAPNWNKVFLEGKISTRPRLVIVGANPGVDEAKNNRLFIGASGQLLREEAARVGLDVNRAVIMNALFCSSPDTEGISNVHINHCRTFHQELLEILRPEIVLCLGSVAARSVLGIASAAVEPGWKNLAAPYRVYVTFHPAHIARDPTEEDRFREDLRTVKEALD